MESYEQLKQDPILSQESREAWIRADHEAAWVTRTYQQLLEDQDRTDEAKQRLAAEEYERRKEKVERAYRKARESILKQAKSAQDASIPKPAGQPLSSADTNSILADQNEASRIVRTLERRQSKGGPFAPNISDFLKREYRRGIEVGGPEGGAICRGVRRAGEELGVGEEWLNELRDDRQLERLDQARRLEGMAYSVPGRAPEPPKALRPQRTLSKRPERNRAAGPVLVPRTAAPLINESEGSLSHYPAKKQTQRKGKKGGARP